MLTLDLSEKLHPEFADAEGATLDAAYNSLPSSLRERVEKTYADKISNVELKRCALIYPDAMDFAAEASAILGDGIDLRFPLTKQVRPHFRNIIFLWRASLFTGM